MADILFDVGALGAKVRYRDMGDGSFAEVISSSGGADGVTDGALYSGTVTGTGVLWWGSATGFKSGTFTTTAVGSGIQIVAEGSNNTTNGTDGSWSAIPLATITSGVTSGVGGLFAAGSMEFLVHHIFIRIRIASGTGTTSGNIVFKRGQTTFYGRVGLDSGNQTIGNVNAGNGWLDSTTALGSSASYTGSARILSLYGQFCFFTATAYADVAGTLYIDWSADNNVSWQVLNSVAVAAGQTQPLTVRLPSFAANVSLRVRYVNGGSAQTTFRLASSLTAN